MKEWRRREQRESEKTTWKVHACPTPAPSSLCAAQLHGKLALPFYFPLVAMHVFHTGFFPFFMYHDDITPSFNAFGTNKPTPSYSR